MKRIFRNIFLFATAFFVQKNTVAKKANPIVDKANFIQQRIFQAHNKAHDNPNNFIYYIDKHHNLDKIETEVSDRIAGENWWNWYNWDTWNTWYTWDTWDTWDTWNTWYTWDNWSNWFNWTNY